MLQGKLEDAFSLYEQAIAIEKGKEHSQTLPMLFAQYSRFVYLVGLATYLQANTLLNSCSYLKLVIGWICILIFRRLCYIIIMFLNL